MATGLLLTANPMGAGKKAVKKRVKETVEKTAKDDAMDVVKKNDTAPPKLKVGDKTIYVKHQSYGYDVVIVDKNGKGIVSVIGGNAKNGVPNTMPDPVAVKKC